MNVISDEGDVEVGACGSVVSLNEDIVDDTVWKTAKGLLHTIKQSIEISVGYNAENKRDCVESFVQLACKTQGECLIR